MYSVKRENCFYHYVCAEAPFEYSVSDNPENPAVYLEESDIFKREADSLIFAHDELKDVVIEKAHITINQYFPKQARSTEIQKSPFHFSVYLQARKNECSVGKAVLRVYFNSAGQMALFTLDFQDRYYVGDQWLHETSEQALSIVQPTLYKLISSKDQHCQMLNQRIDGLDQQIAECRIQSDSGAEFLRENVDQFCLLVDELNRYSGDRRDCRDLVLRQIFQLDDHSKIDVDQNSANQDEQRVLEEVSEVHDFAITVREPVTELQRVSDRLDELSAKLSDFELNVSSDIWNNIAHSEKLLTDKNLEDIANWIYEYKTLALVYHKVIKEKKSGCKKKNKKAAAKPMKKLSAAQLDNLSAQQSINNAYDMVKSMLGVKDSFDLFLSQEKVLGVKRLYPMLRGESIADLIVKFVSTIFNVKDDEIISNEAVAIADFLYKNSSVYQWTVIRCCEPLIYFINGQGATEFCLNLPSIESGFHGSLLVHSFIKGDYKAFRLLLEHGVSPDGIHVIIIRDNKNYRFTLLQFLCFSFLKSQPTVDKKIFIKTLIDFNVSVQQDVNHKKSVRIKNNNVNQLSRQENEITELLQLTSYTNCLELFYAKYGQWIFWEDDPDFFDIYQSLRACLERQMVRSMIGRIMPENDSKVSMVDFKLDILCFSMLYFEVNVTLSDGCEDTENQFNLLGNAIEIFSNFLEEEKVELINFFLVHAEKLNCNKKFYSSVSLTNCIIVFLSNSLLDKNDSTRWVRAFLLKAKCFREAEDQDCQIDALKQLIEFDRIAMFDADNCQLILNETGMLESDTVRQHFSEEEQEAIRTISRRAVGGIRPERILSSSPSSVYGTLGDEVAEASVDFGEGASLS